jgi:hypothetical protein
MAILVILSIFLLGCPGTTGAGGDPIVEGTTTVTDGTTTIPASLTIGTSKTAKILANETAYYKFTTATAGAYAITAAAFSGNVASPPDLIYLLYSDSAFSSSIDSEDANDLGFTTINLTAATSYYLSIRSFDTGNIGFSLTVTAPLPDTSVSEGSTSSTVALALGSARTCEVAASESSYYSITTAGGGAYSFDVTSIDSGVELSMTISDKSDFSSTYASNFYNTTPAAYTSTTYNYAATTYYLKFQNYGTRGGHFSLTISAPTTSYAVGSTGPGGGIVIYDKGSFSNGWRYLEAEKVDIGSSLGTKWTQSDVTPTLIGASATGLGDGLANSTAISLAQVSPGYIYDAATRCLDHMSSTYLTDWYLPSKDELQLMQTELYAKSLGSLSGTYWSSSEAEATKAWQLSMSSNAWFSYNKQVNQYLRPIRRF